MLLSTYRLDAHTDAVATVTANSALVATGGWDHTIHLWRWPQLVEDLATGGPSASGSAKRSTRDNSGSGEEAAAAVSTGGHDSVVCDSAAALQGHAQVGTFLL